MKIAGKMVGKGRESGGKTPGKWREMVGKGQENGGKMAGKWQKMAGKWW